MEETTFWWTELVTSHLWASRTPPVSWMISPASRLDPKGVTQHVHESCPFSSQPGTAGARPTALHRLLPCSLHPEPCHARASRGSVPAASAACAAASAWAGGGWGQGWPPDLGLRPHLTTAHDAPTFPQDDSDGSIVCERGEEAPQESLQRQLSFLPGQGQGGGWSVVCGGPGAGQAGAVCPGPIREARGGAREVKANRGADWGGTERPEGGF